MLEVAGEHRHRTRRCALGSRAPSGLRRSRKCSSAAFRHAIDVVPRYGPGWCKARAGWRSPGDQAPGDAICETRKSTSYPRSEPSVPATLTTLAVSPAMVSSFFTDSQALRITVGVEKSLLQLDECASGVLMSSVDLVSVANGDDVLAGRFNSYPLNLSMVNSPGPSILPIPAAVIW